MSVDVFGHQLPKSKVRNGSIGARGPTGEGFMITEDERLNQISKRILSAKPKRLPQLIEITSKSPSLKPLKKTKSNVKKRCN
ncbi:hypothetical protein HCN44_000446 [Aphidius gifuensis]|uniref:Uncharacterized protein n=1 Tax=Aphidius gifuensis TaxID=684658 RepID=A0A834XPR1_APHGI|nr:hypothetical protein HCN44_000446 [Aphidius gifuensis]